MIPAKYAALSVFGTTAIGKVISLSTECSGGKPILPQPSLTAKFSITGTEYEIHGGQEGVPEFCNLKVGDAVKVAYFLVPKINHMVVTTGNPKEIFLTMFAGGIFLFIVGNLMLALSKWEEKKKTRKVQV